jgi:putative tryptophan/tyrosine transport system substrate-binding protein
MRRRDFLGLVPAAATVWPRFSVAQRATRRVAILSAFPTAERRLHMEAFRNALSKKSWIENSNLSIDYRTAEGDASRLPAMASDLIKLKPDAVFAMATPALVAAKRETQTIPTVFVNVSDPVDGGFVQSMARPGANITGFTSFEYSIGGKWLELLKETSPSLSRTLVLYNSVNYTSRALLQTIRASAPTLSLTVVTADIRQPSDIETAISHFASEANGGLIVLPDPATTAPLRSHILPSALKYRLPSIQTFPYFAAAGGLMSYGADDLDIYSRAGEYMARILAGEHPRDLPVQNPVKFRLIVNLKTAKAIGLTVSPNLLTRADEVIE